MFDFERLINSLIEAYSQSLSTKIINKNKSKLWCKFQSLNLD